MVTVQKPYCLQMGKESTEQYKVQNRFQESILKMEDGIVVNDAKLKLKATLSCDRKARELVMGNAGAFCDLCPLTKEECEDVENIKQGFEITKTVQDLCERYENLKDDDDENEVKLILFLSLKASAQIQLFNWKITERIRIQIK